MSRTFVRTGKVPLAARAEERARVSSWLPIFIVAVFLAMSTACGSSQVNPNSPVGLWKTVDDETGEDRSMIRLWIENERLYGKIEKLIGVDEKVVCIKCKGAKYGAPVIGLTILEGLKEDGHEWSGGTILDPKNGKTYRCLVEVLDGGAKLKVRGYVGFSFLGRTQIWYRVK